MSRGAHPTLDRDLADAQSHREKAKAQLHATVDRLLRQGLPACVVARRASCSDTLVHRLAKDRGIKLVRFTDWSES